MTSKQPVGLLSRLFANARAKKPAPPQKSSQPKTWEEYTALRDQNKQTVYQPSSAGVAGNATTTAPAKPKVASTLPVVDSLPRNKKRVRSEDNTAAGAKKQKVAGTPLGKPTASPIAGNPLDKPTQSPTKPVAGISKPTTSKSTVTKCTAPPTDITSSSSSSESAGSEPATPQHSPSQIPVDGLYGDRYPGRDRRPARKKWTPSPRQAAIIPWVRDPAYGSEPDTDDE